MYNAYLFHVLLHEYVHALGEYDENVYCQKTAAICRAAFVTEHAVTRLASDPSFLAPLLYQSPSVPGNKMDARVRLVHGFGSEAVRHNS